MNESETTLPESPSPPLRTVGKDDSDNISEPAPNGSGSVIEEHNKQVQAESEEELAKRRQEEIEKSRKELEALDPETNAVRRMIGKLPEHGGKEKEYLICVQEKLPWIPKLKFFSLTSRMMAESVKSSGGAIGSMSDILNDDEGGSFTERGRRWIQKDFGDLGSFITLIFELIGNSEKYMVECYCIWLNVPKDDRDWARDRFREPWAPERGLWGLKDEDHESIFNTFIDQNYEDIRSFFVEKVPGMLKRMALHERSRERKPIIPTSSLDR